jgi:hypothetical protein
MAASDSNAVVSASMRFHGERRPVVVFQADADLVAVARVAEARGREENAALVVGLAPSGAAAQLGWASLGPVPALTRPLRLALLPTIPLVAPFGRRRRVGVREITSLPVDVRITRLWDRFSIDVGVALERNTKLFGWRIHERADTPYRIFIFEDGDRYAIRALCIFKIDGSSGYVMELLHDRSVTGMRAASHLLGLALREMSDAGVASARALSLPHSGSYPIFARHAFFSAPSSQELVVHALDPEVEDSVTLRDRWYVSYVDAMEL